MSRIYLDFFGNPTSLDKLCQHSPEWAANRIREAEKEHELACAAADAWAHASQKRLSDYCDAHHYADGLPAALDALELATRNSPLRKVKPQDGGGS